MYLYKVTEIEIQNIIKSLKKGAAGYDEVDASALKMISDSVSLPLTHLCNLSLSQGVFPHELKLANVIPLYKSDDPCVFNHYRPVSLLSVLSKVFEKVMYERLISYLDTYDIIFQNQFGFRKMHSSYMALMVLMDKLIKSLENGEHIVGVFLDFSKAFDTVDHNILLSKLDHYGVRGPAFDWFRSYLKDRSQFVTYNGVSSSTRTIKCGVPQGSILGPLLFLIYINDLQSVCKHTTPILFADDTNLFTSGKDIVRMQDDLNSELSKISLWLKVNKLSLNIKKTHFMFITRKKHRPNQVDLQIDGERIHEVQKTKFLGFIIDNKLNWKDHISYVKNKIAKGLGMIIKARHLLNKNALMTLYFSFIYPYLTYCNHIWGSTYVSNLKKLATMQNKIVRIICGVPPRHTMKPLYEELGILQLQKINQFLIARFMFRYTVGKVPDLFRQFFIRNEEFHSYFTRRRTYFHIPGIKSDTGKTGIRYQGTLVWNLLLEYGINPHVSEAVFVKLVKKLLLSGTFPDTSLSAAKST